MTKKEDSECSSQLNVMSHILRSAWAAIEKWELMARGTCVHSSQQQNTAVSLRSQHWGGNHQKWNTLYLLASLRCNCTVKKIPPACTMAKNYKPHGQGNRNTHAAAAHPGAFLPTSGWHNNSSTKFNFHLIHYFQFLCYQEGTLDFQCFLQPRRILSHTEYFAVYL